MDHSKFEYVLAIAKEKNMTQAAKKLYISQPALTVTINKLEERLGVKLFDRTSNPIQLTYAGERYITEMQKIIALEHRLSNELEEIAGMRRGRLVIGIGNARGEYWLPHIVPPFLKAYPGIDIKIVEGKSDVFEEGLLKGTIDLCITALPNMSLDIDFDIICEETIILAVAPGHPILKGKNLSGNDLEHLLYIEPERLNGQTFICPSPGHGLYRCTWQIFEKHGIKPGEIREINNSDTAFHLASEGLGLVFTPDNSVTPPYPPHIPVCCTVDLPPYRRKIIAAYNKHIGLSPSAQAFIQLTKDIVATSPALKIPPLPERPYYSALRQST